MIEGTSAKELDTSGSVENMSSSRTKPSYTKDGNVLHPNFGGNSGTDGAVRGAVEKNKQQQMMQSIKNTLPKVAGEALGAAGIPGGEPLAKAFLDSDTGEKMLEEATANAETEVEGTATLLQKIKNRMSLIVSAGTIAAVLAPLVVLIFGVVILLQAGPTMFWSWVSGIFGGSDTYNIEPAEQREGEDEDKMTNPVNNFYTILEAIDKKVAEINDELGVDIDKNLIAATLLGPIDNSMLVDGDGKNMYIRPDNGKQVDWAELQDFYIKQIDFLAKAQVKSVVAADEDKCNTKAEKEFYWTPMQYAKNDDPYDGWQLGDWLPWNWKNDMQFNRRVEAEKNYKCTLAEDPMPDEKRSIPEVYVSSYMMGDIKREYGEKVVDLFGMPKTGGVYFWNLVNPDGFIYTHYRAFLENSDDEGATFDYENSRNRIMEIAEAIYIYYEGMGEPQFCKGYKLVENSIDKIVAKDPCESGSCEFTEPEFEERENPDDPDNPLMIPKCRGNNSSGTFDLEYYVAGVLSMEFGNGAFEIDENSSDITKREGAAFTEEYVEWNGKKWNIEGLKAMAILARTYGLYTMDRNKFLENSSNNQNFNYAWQGCINESGEVEGGHYNKELIAAAVKATKGLVITKYSSSKGKFEIYPSEYDAFCPTTQMPKDDGFYYLPNAQRALPVLGEWAIGHGIDKTWAYCPCFESESKRPSNKYTSSPSKGPNDIDSRCWNYVGERPRKLDDGTTIIEYAWKYKPSGGHGRGISQWGMKYYTEQGYDALEVLKLFSDRDNGGGITPVKIMRTTGSLDKTECFNVVVDQGNNNNGDNPGNSGNGNYTTPEVTHTKNILNMRLDDFLNSKEPDGFRKFNEMIGQAVADAGPGTRAGVVAYASSLIGILDRQHGYRIPYHWGRGFPGHSAKPTDYAFGGWGRPYRSCPSGAPRCYDYDGMDCSSFVPIAIYNGGYNYGSGGATSLKNRYSMGKSSNLRPLSSCNAQPGDVLWHPGHIMLIVGVNNGSILIAHAKGGDYGVLIEEKACNDKAGDVIVDMTDWYSNNQR